MNGEIKFRAWDKKNEKFIEFFSINQNGEVFTDHGDPNENIELEIHIKTKNLLVEKRVGSYL